MKYPISQKGARIWFVWNRVPINPLVHIGQSAFSLWNNYNWGVYTIFRHAHCHNDFRMSVGPKIPCFPMKFAHEMPPFPQFDWVFPTSCPANCGGAASLRDVSPVFTPGKSWGWFGLDWDTGISWDFMGFEYVRIKSWWFISTCFSLLFLALQKCSFRRWRLRIVRRTWWVSSWGLGGDRESSKRLAGHGQFWC